MSEGHTASGRASNAAHSAGVGVARLIRAWRSLPQERRVAALAAFGLFVALFLPWYQQTLIAGVANKPLQQATATLTGWAAFSFVEAAVLLVAVGVLTLLFQRAEGRAFHLPGGDGWVITAAGFWTCALIVWRIFDKQGATTHGPSATTSGIEWGIFVALAVAALLTYSGQRIRAAHQPEPPLPGDAPAPPARPAPPAPDEWPAREYAAPPAPRREELRSWSAADPPEDPTARIVPPATPAGAAQPVRAPAAQGERPGWSRFSSGPGDTRVDPRPRPARPPDDQLTIPLEDEER